MPLVALTGYGQPDDRARTSKAGFDEHLVKPVGLADLDAVLVRVGERRVSAEGAGSGVRDDVASRSIDRTSARGPRGP